MYSCGPCTAVSINPQTGHRSQGSVVQPLYPTFTPLRRSLQDCLPLWTAEYQVQLLTPSYLDVVVSQVLGEQRRWMSSHHHHRQSSAFSTASAFRSTSRSPSPSPSPLSPTPADSDQGLSRRHSWNRPRQDTTLQGSDAPLHPLAYTGGALSSSSRAHLGMYDDHEYDLGLGNRPAQPYTHQYSSQTSLASTDIGYGQSDLDLPTSRTGNAETNDDQRWLSPGPSTLPYSTPHKKPYDAEGNPRLSSGGRIAGSVARSSTLRAVSRTIRSAGKRVVNLGGKEREDGLSRLPDDDNDIDDDSTDELKRTETVEMVEASASRPRPEAMPPEGLRGRTLGLFGPRSRVRRTMDGLMRHSYVVSFPLRSCNLTWKLDGTPYPPVDYRKRGHLVDPSGRSAQRASPRQWLLSFMGRLRDPRSIRRIHLRDACSNHRDWSRPRSRGLGASILVRSRGPHTGRHSEVQSRNKCTSTEHVEIHPKSSCLEGSHS